MIVCVCRRVTDHQIRKAVDDGAHSLECLQFDLGVATQCGRCAECACGIVEQCNAALPVAAISRPETRALAGVE